MKVIALTTAAVFAATTAFAGNMETMAAEPMEMVEMETADAGSAGSMGGLGWLLPVVVIGAIIAASED